MTTPTFNNRAFTIMFSRNQGSCLPFGPGEIGTLFKDLGFGESTEEADRGVVDAWEKIKAAGIDPAIVSIDKKILECIMGNLSGEILQLALRQTYLTPEI